MNNYLLIVTIIFYLLGLFLIAFFAEKKAKSKWVNNAYVYALSLAVYCSAWTYYGSVGIAATSGIYFLPIYLGPVIAIPLWIVVMRKVIRISKQHKISSIADFISLRYGNNRFLGALVTIICVLGIVPYISLQLKAVSETFVIMTARENISSVNILSDSTFYIAVILAIFSAFYGTQATDASEKHKGIVATVALESVIKLIFFLIIGIYVTFFLYDGTTDIYQQISKTPNFEKLVTIDSLESGFNWSFTIALSFFAIFLLPRQFQVTVLENTRSKHLKKAIWLFPLYLLLFNVFVIFIAWAGKLSLDASYNPEYYTLFLPLSNNNTILALLVFLGGFSAVISMVVVSTLALSTMVSNNLIIPYGYLDKFSKGESGENSIYIKTIRRVSIFSLIIAAYLFYFYFSIELSLYSIGLIAFVIISQLAPSFFIGLYWNRGSSKASILAISVGFLITAYTLIVPFTIEAISGSRSFIDNGLFEIALLKPHSLFGIDFLTPPAHAFFWSMLFNTLIYLSFSLVSKGHYRERNYAEMFVDTSNFSSLQDSALVWKGEAYVADIKAVLIKFLGEERTERALNLFFEKYKLSNKTHLADARLINFSEKLLTGSIGSASAKILIASVVKEEEISLVEVLKILEEAKEAKAINKALTEKSNELTLLTNKLQDANNELIVKDKQKDDFLDTVAHELKTPLTGIRAATELILEDDNVMPAKLKNKFLTNILQDSERLSRLINNILDFEKLSTGREKLNLENYNIKSTIEQSVNSIQQLAVQKGVTLVNKSKDDFYLSYDEDRILQVLTNLLSNAIKFSDSEKGIVEIDYSHNKFFLTVSVKDNGKGIPVQDFDYIFDKFYQSENQNIQKPIGSGLGLAISKHIVEKHNGVIWAKNNVDCGAIFGFTLPF